MTKKNNNLFNELAIQSNITDIKSVKLFYYALIRTLYKLLKQENSVSMPDWGTYRIKPHASRNIHDLQTGGTRPIPAINTIRFEADYKLKEKIKSIDVKT